MKTIEEKAKAYDEVLEKVKNILKERVAPLILEPDELEELFPELTESEDERIRRELIEYIKSAPIPNIDYIAWLEKQDKKESDPRKNILEELLHADDIYQMSTNDIMVEEAKQKAIAALSKMEISKLLGIEKQKPAAEEIPHEPKFKNGDWIVYTKYRRTIFQIQSVYEDGSYLMTDYNLLASENEPYMHLWTIQDAKDGDVLAYSDSRHTWICIFKERINNRIYDYCSYNENGDEIGFYPRKSWSNDKIFKYTPAIQSQKETLFKAMADAGYTWDAEKKELKKFSIEDTTQLVEVQKHTEWSEEDEYYYNIIWYYLHDQRVGSTDKENAITWLESLYSQKQWKSSD